MATWRDIAPSEDAVNAPATSQLAKAWTSNVIATAECADGAPYMQTAWHPHDGTFEGDGGDGVVYDFATDGAVSSIDIETWEDGYEYGFIFDGLEQSASFDINVYAYRNGAYSSPVVLIGASTDPYNGGIMYAPRPFVPSYRRVLHFESAIFSNGANYTEDPLLIDTSGIAVSWDGISLEPAGGTFDAGRLIMVKRKAYI